jgi:hypothetical protein
MSDAIPFASSAPARLGKAPGVQAELVDQEPERFFVPPYVGPRGWVGLRLDVDLDWDEVAVVVEESWRLTAPKRLTAEFDPG